MLCFRFVVFEAPSSVAVTDFTENYWASFVELCSEDGTIKMWCMYGSFPYPTILRQLLILSMISTENHNHLLVRGPFFWKIIAKIRKWSQRMYSSVSVYPLVFPLFCLRWYSRWWRWLFGWFAASPACSNRSSNRSRRSAGWTWIFDGFIHGSCQQIFSPFWTKATAIQRWTLVTFE